MLAFLSIAAAVFVAVAIVKPWAGRTPFESPASTSTLAAAVRETAAVGTAPPESTATLPSPMAYEMPQAGFIVVQPGELSPWTGTCSDGSSDGSSDGAGTYFFATASEDPSMSLGSVGVVVTCSDGTVQWVQLVVPSPTAP